MRFLSYFSVSSWFGPLLWMAALDLPAVVYRFFMKTVPVMAALDMLLMYMATLATFLYTKALVIITSLGTGSN